MYLIAAAILLEGALPLSNRVIGIASAAGSGHEPARSDSSASVVVSKPLMHARDLVQLPGLPRLFRGPFGPLLKELPHPAQASAVLQQTASLWPEELVANLPRSAFTGVDSIVRAFMIGTLVQGAREAGVSARKDLSVLQRALSSQLRTVRLPEFSVSARFTDATTSAAVWRMVDEITAALAAQGLKVSRGRNSVAVKFRLGQLIDAPALAAMAVELGWAAGPRDPLAKVVSAALGRMNVEASMVLAGSVIEVAMGPRQVAQGEAAAMPVVPAAIPREALVATARWEVGPLRTMVAGWRELWAKWEGTSAGKRTRAADEDDMMGDIVLLSRTLDAAGDRGEAWIWVDRGVHTIVREHGTAPLTPLASDPLGALLPADLVAVDIEAGRNLGQLLSNGLERVESRLAYRSLRQPSEDEDNPRGAVKKEAAYYKTFAHLRELIHFKAHTFFYGSSAVMLGAGTRIQRVELRLSGRPPVILKDVSVPEVAVLGRAKDPVAALGFVADAWTAIGNALAGPLGGPAVAPRLTPAPPLVPEATVRWLDGSWLEQTTGDTITFDDGFKPHVALLDDFVVLSTSPALTRKILSLRSVAVRGRMSLPSTQAPLVGWSRIPCAPLARQAGNGLAAGEKMFGPMNFGTPAQPRSPTTIGQIFNLACEVVTDATEIGIQQGGEKTTRYDATAASGLYRP